MPSGREPMIASGQALIAQEEQACCQVVCIRAIRELEARLAPLAVRPVKEVLSLRRNQ